MRSSVHSGWWRHRRLSLCFVWHMHIMFYMSSAPLMPAALLQWLADCFNNVGYYCFKYYYWVHVSSSPLECPPCPASLPPSNLGECFASTCGGAKSPALCFSVPPTKLWAPWKQKSWRLFICLQARYNSENLTHVAEQTAGTRRVGIWGQDF